MKKLIAIVISLIFIFNVNSIGRSFPDDAYNKSMLRKPLDFDKSRELYPRYQIVTEFVSEEGRKLMDPKTPETEKQRIRKELWEVIGNNLGEKMQWPNMTWIIEQLKKMPFAYHVNNLTLGVVSKARNNLISDERSILRGELHIAVEDLCRSQKKVTDIGHPGRFEEEEELTNAMSIMLAWAYNYTDPNSIVIPFTMNETEITILELVKSMLHSYGLDHIPKIIEDLIRTPVIYRISMDAILIAWAHKKISVYKGPNESVSHVLLLGKLPLLGVEYCCLPREKPDSKELLKLLRRTSSWHKAADILLDDPLRAIYESPEYLKEIENARKVKNGI